MTHWTFGLEAFGANQDSQRLADGWHRTADGDYFHAGTQAFADRFYFEVVQRSRGYDGYGALNAPILLAATVLQDTAMDRWSIWRALEERRQCLPGRDADCQEDERRQDEGERADRDPEELLHRLGRGSRGRLGVDHVVQLPPRG